MQPGWQRYHPDLVVLLNSMNFSLGDKQETNMTVTFSGIEIEGNSRDNILMIRLTGKLTKEDCNIVQAL
ncbi:MAG: hypothetical protein ACE5EH_12695 [Gammaproteobacteria bacterium]